MRFILFNLVVGAAVVYLISGNAGDAVRNAGFSETTASVIEYIGNKARATVANAVEKTPNGAPTAVENPKPKAVAKTPNGAPTAVENSKPKEVAKTHETSATAIKTPEPKKTVPPLEETKTVISRPIHKTPPSKADTVDGAPKGQLASVSPEVDKRRTEILGRRDDGPKYAIEGGEQLMSATDRYRELSKLVDDMELVYFNSLGN
ncbi:MAG: hypothetical protein VX973_12460 [Pseudomonadota bacterium]|nr:hypothetical protein [Pseudomonadota bacterium]